MNMYSITQFVQVNRNLYRTNAAYWRLFAVGETPNNCWLYGSKMVELKDIDTATGRDVYGSAEVELSEGTTPASYEYIRYTR